MPNSVDDGWINLFPDYINIKDLKIFISPNKDFKNAWKESNPTTTVNPLVRMEITL
jgi:hypothetical protein